MANGDSRSDPSRNRNQLFNALSNLSRQDFEWLLFALRPPGGLIPGPEAPQMNRVKALLDWAEGSSGRGIDEVEDYLDQLDTLLGPGPTTPDFRPYLQSILDDEDYLDWQGLYTPTTVEGQKPAPSSKHSRRLKLRAETVKPSKDQRLGDQTTNQREEIEQLDVLDGLHKYAAEHVLLIGKPGSGKSTSMEWLLWNEAQNALEHPEAKIPVLVKLRRCTSTIEALIRDFLSRHYLPLNVQDIERLLQQGKVLLLLDGLNELPEAHSTEIANFRERYRKTTPMIVSTRDLSVGGTLGIVKSLKMLPLSEPQMREFVLGYLPKEGDRLLQQLKGDRLRKFAETPLLLWMLYRVFDQNGQVPANLGLAFREFTQLYDRQIQEDAPADSKDQWPKLLRHLAFALMHDKELVGFRLTMPREEAEDLLTAFLQQEGRTNARANAERWLQDLLDYHLIQPVIQENLEEHIEFRHQLIQEYYAAEYLLRLLPGLSDEQLKQDYLNLLKWTEAIALMLALVPDENQALRVVKLALDVDWMLGARLAGEVKPKAQAQTIKLVKELKIASWLKIKLLGRSQSREILPELIESIKDPCIHEEVVIEALIQNPFTANHLSRMIEFLENETDYVRTRISNVLSSLDPDFIIPQILRYLTCSDENLVFTTIKILGDLEHERAVVKLLPLLKHEDYRIRKGIVQSLRFQGSATATPELVRLLRDPNEDVRFCAAEALAFLRCGEGKTILVNALENADFYEKIRISDALSRLRFFTDSKKSAQKKLGEKSIGKQELYDPLGKRKEMSERLNSKDITQVQSAVLDGIKSDDLYVRWLSRSALYTLEPLNAAHLLKFISMEHGEDALKAIEEIQTNCKFYNYDIWQDSLQSAGLENQHGRQGIAAGQATTIFNIDTLHAPNAAINLGGTIYGDQIGTQNP
ncbi:MULTISPECIES: HEAT repeat domain-containing protein [Cyanophyceae]|uniref:HEAT repeat domain-containing protein n=1 Tax=Cyanophyceae TaxID=3028117 RepID=UPI001683298F|nr:MULTISPECIES: HEAT repeat domain-containing protein [Cyanophyceae]MBD1915145.1 HEAT repeat domain-containing protein [Phormidium sp. FACHB-77]MBD2030936.1 HEAT repeat domain-containing protein [Phormidium sp. FACHB-322]MBD2050717.1 HEAT repeat domain-containing protein [Leptolyngbya sp. FACHB-60]